MKFLIFECKVKDNRVWWCKQIITFLLKNCNIHYKKKGFQTLFGLTAPVVKYALPRYRFGMSIGLVSLSSIRCSVK